MLGISAPNSRRAYFTKMPSVYGMANSDGDIFTVLRDKLEHLESDRTTFA